MFAELTALLSELREKNQRQLLIISGDDCWCDRQIAQIGHVLSNIVYITTYPHGLTPSAKSLLGQESKHIIYDIRQGVCLEDMAILAGTIKSGGLLILITPNWEAWHKLPDQDSLRWSGNTTAIPTPNFVHYFQQLAIEHDVRFIWQQSTVGCEYNTALSVIKGSHFEQIKWSLTNRECDKKSLKLTSEQKKILHGIMAVKQGIIILRGERGRGKSTLAGFLAAQYRKCWVTALHKKAAMQILQLAENNTQFWSPDQLLEYCQNSLSNVFPDWLIIDEAAALPVSLLETFILYFPRILLTTTTAGYEGSARGFIHKFCHNHPDARYFELKKPFRWSHEDDYLDQFMQQLLMNNLIPKVSESVIRKGELTSITYELLTQKELLNPLSRLQQIYQLLSHTHYRSTLIDLRRFLDAPNLYYVIAHLSSIFIGIAVSHKEGGINASLSAAIWAGKRRLKGHLVAQALAYHANCINAVIFVSLRISRIAVRSTYRRMGIASNLVSLHVEHAKRLQCDFVSVSFSYTVELYQFWVKCGFRLVHVSNYKEASSGCYAVMMIYPLTEKAQNMANNLFHELYRNKKWMTFFPLHMTPLIFSHEAIHQITPFDIQQLYGFAFHLRTLDICRSALCRMLLKFPDDCHLLYRHLIKRQSISDISKKYNITGKKALLTCWRNEVKALWISGKLWRLLDNH